MTKILVVDDEPLVLLTIKSLCDWEKHNMHIAYECRNGRDALAYLKDHPETDVVLTDVDMPVMDGLSLAEILKREGCTAKIIFLSSYSNFEYVRRAFKSGACDYILKTELDEKKIVGLILKLQQMHTQNNTHIRTEDISDSANNKNDMELRTAFFNSLIDEACTTDTAAFFSSCQFSVSCPFSFMILRPGDMPLVRQRYKNNLYDFQKTASDLLRHFVPAGDGDSGAISFDQYYVLMNNAEQMDKVFDRFYEAAWSYMDIGFERKTGGPVEDPKYIKENFVSCLRNFVSPSRIVVRTRRYIREHFGNPALNLSEIAAYSEVSKNHLSWEFTRETGENISDFITRTRIQEAKKLLIETNLRTYEIAERTGYANVETFCRVFRKITGTSPRRFC